jgi:uncharacterized protein
MRLVPSHRHALVGPALALALALLQVGCGGHEARTLRMRTALDVGNPKAAIAALNQELGVATEKDQPKSVNGDDALLVLDRASIQQSIAQFDLSKKDFEAADKGIDMLDLSRNAGDSVGEYMFSDSSGKYKAPPYEKLLINTLNLVNYLETGDTQGALVEARRLAVTQKFLRDTQGVTTGGVFALGSLLAGFTYEKTGNIDEALRYYDEVAARGHNDLVRDAVARLYARGTFKSPRLEALAKPATQGDEQAHNDELADVLFVVGYGRVPHKIPERVPIGLALTLFANDISPASRAQANELAAQGLVTWVNYPTLAPATGQYASPVCALDGQRVSLSAAADVADEVRTEWRRIEGKIIVSAITRLITRVAVGQGIRAAAGRDNAVGLIGSLVAQASLSALDTPDTRSWETLPAHVSVARVRVAAGAHRVEAGASGYRRTQALQLAPGGFAVVSLMALH